MSPVSVASQISLKDTQQAEQVFDMFISVLNTPTLFAKFSAALPVTRICLLLLGDKPSPAIATHVLNLLSLSIRSTTSFVRKFELVSGWSVLKNILPGCWDKNVNEAAMDLFLGRMENSSKEKKESQTSVMCPNMAPVILSALQTGLNTAIISSGKSENGSGTPFHPSSYTFLSHSYSSGSYTN